MGKITPPTSVKLFIGILSQDSTLIEQLTIELTNIFGPVDLESPVWPWEHTSYYQKEMGPGLKRKFIFFETLMNPSGIPEIKVKTNELENQYLHDGGGRRVNLDPGYLDAAKLVLVSTKNFSHRIYLNQGIYGEVTLIYAKDHYQPLPYTFPDYRTEDYLGIFTKARDIFRGQLKA